MIQVLKREEIDSTKYDACIMSAEAKTVYALSWYLDVVSPKWSAVVVDDYRIVMPIPIKNKFGIRYALQPMYCQQLGIFSASPIDKNMARKIISKLPFFYILNFNFSNNTLISNTLKRTNYILHLKPDYKTIVSKYSHHLQRNISKSKRYNQHLSSISEKEFIDFYKHNSGTWLNEKHISVLEKLLIATKEQNACEIIASRNEKEEILAAIFFINSCNRKYSLVIVSSSEGYMQQSTRFLFNAIIEQNCGQDIILDFEGSELPGVKKFFHDFGGINQEYSNISKNAWLFKRFSHKK